MLRISLLTIFLYTKNAIVFSFHFIQILYEHFFSYKISN